MNDLPKTVNEQLYYGFEDQTATSKTCSSIALRCSVNCARLNDEKCTIENFKEPLNAELNGNSVTPAVSKKDLGLTVKECVLVHKY